MTKHFVQILFALLFVISGVISTSAAPIMWTDWDEYGSHPAGTAAGKITTGTGSINVGLSGIISGIYQNTSWWSPATTFTGLTAPSDMVTEHYRGTVNLTFDKPVEDIYIALFSVGNSAGAPIIYDFNTPIEVISSGPSDNFAGGGFATVGADYIIGAESNGILKLAGTFTGLTFTIDGPGDEWWHGFNIGVDSIASDPSPVPEPSTALLLGIGLAGTAYAGRRMRKA